MDLHTRLINGKQNRAHIVRAFIRNWSPLGRFLFRETYKDVGQGVLKMAGGMKNKALKPIHRVGNLCPDINTALMALAAQLKATHAAWANHLRRGLGGERTHGEDAERGYTDQNEGPALGMSSLSRQVLRNCLSLSPQRIEGGKILTATYLNRMCAPEHKPCLTHERSREKQIKMSNCPKTN